MTLIAWAAIGISCIFLQVLLEGGGVGAAVLAAIGAAGLFYYLG
jgi:hypothetical protein